MQAIFGSHVATFGRTYRWIQLDNPEHELSLFDDDRLVSAFQLKAEGKGVSSHAWSADGRLLAAADRDNTIRVWDISKRELINTLAGHEATIWRLAWSPDGKRLASRSEDKTVRLWDPVSGKLLATYEAFPEPMDTGLWLRGLDWTPDSQPLWIALSTHAIQLDVPTGPCRRWKILARERHHVARGLSGR